eukprot:scaffold5400_cov159-Ochromonas_danica.AAC.11
MLSSLGNYPDIISDSRQDPVSYTRLDPEDVIRIWTAHTREAAVSRGRGRGRANGRSDGIDNENGRDFERPDNRDDLWSGESQISGPGDLSDLAAAALNFRSQLNDLKFDGQSSIKEEDEDMMIKLIREQADHARLESAVEDDEPAWAKSDGTNASDAKDVIKIAVETTPPREQEPLLVGAVSGGLNSALRAGIPDVSRLDLQPQARPAPVEWLYMDPQGEVQGPFSQENMRLWYEGGYFPPDLPIKLRNWTVLHAFNEVFEDMRKAFLFVPPEPGSKHAFIGLPVSFNTLSSSAAPASTDVTDRRGVASRHAIAASFESPLSDPAPLATVNRDIGVGINSGSAASASSVNQSLPIVTSNSAATSSTKDVNVRHRASTSAVSTEQAKSPVNIAVSHSVSKSNYAKQLLGISSKQESASTKPERSEADKSNSVDQSPNTKVQQQEISRGAKGWNLTEAAAPISLAQIQQQEEEEKSKTTTSSQPDKANMSSHLKNLLGVKPATAIPTSVSNTTKQVGSASPWNTVAPVAVNPPTSLRDIMKEEINQQHTVEKVSGSASSSASWVSKARSNVSPGSNTVVSSTTVSSGRQLPVNDLSKTGLVGSHTPSQSSVNAKSEFGGKQMSKEMADWCANQLKKLGGMEDITLMHFCMTLNSGVEIRETLSQYLGSSPQVTNFATEFIKYKEEGRRPISNPFEKSTADLNSKTLSASSFVSASKKKKANGK